MHQEWQAQLQQLQETVQGQDLSVVGGPPDVGGSWTTQVETIPREQDAKQQATFAGLQQLHVEAKSEVDGLKARLKDAGRIMGQTKGLGAQGIQREG